MAAPTLDDLLGEAVRDNCLTRAESALQGGASPNTHIAILGLWVFPLHYALVHEYDDMVELLLRYGCDVNIHGAFAIPPPLFYLSMIRQRNMECTSLVQRLIDAGAAVNLEYMGTTPLCSALTQNQESIVRCLLRNGADPNKGTDFVEDEEFISAPDDPSVSTSHDLPLGIAAQHGNVRLMEELLYYGAHVNMRTSEGKSALYFAVVCNFPKAVKLLLSWGAHVHVRNVHGVSVLTSAAELGLVSMTRLLLDSGADVNARPQKSTDSTWTPLHGACLNGSLETARVLLEKGADIEGHSQQHTPVSVAACYSGKGRRAIIHTLLAGGARVPSVNGWAPDQRKVMLAAQRRRALHDGIETSLGLASRYTS